jgi:hypothetical protein
MMQYLKPEILARSRSRDDDIADAAAAEWDQAVARYNADLDVLRPSLPSGARLLVRRYSLHDAWIIGLAQEWRSPRFSLFVRLEGRPSHPGKQLELRYRLARTSRKPWHSLLEELAAEKWPPRRARIQYDEFARVADDPVDVFCHALLLGDGTELHVPFTDMGVRPLQQVFFPPLPQPGRVLA